MNHPLISVIIPVYNAERTLAKCVNSVLQQEMNDFELILVDDGSQDASAQMCDEFAAADNRVKVVHKPNGGVSSARNLGLSHAIGDRITFIDADDNIGPGFFENIQSATEDLLLRGYFAIDNTGSVIKELTHIYVEEMTSLADFISLYISDVLLRSPWGIFYKRKLLEGLSFPEDMKVGEDSCFVFNYLSKCETYKFQAKGYYYHLVGSDSDDNKYAMSSNYAAQSLKHLLDAYRMIEEKFQLDRRCFLTYLTYFKSASKADWRKNPSHWFANDYVRQVYAFLWKEITLKMKIQFCIMSMI